MLAVDVHSLEKSYRRAFGAPHAALRGVDLRIEKGQSFGLIGPNGAGKTTFIKLMLGIARPTGGSVRVLGEDPAEPEVRRRIGYLPERLHLPASLTPPQFLASVARLKGVEAGREIDLLLERTGLAPSRSRRIGAFSKGMRQRLGLAAALLGGPELLILDEPTDGIDPVGRAEVRAILADEAARGTTLFLNSHLLAETERICSRVGILADGKLVREGSLEELTRLRSRWQLRFGQASAEVLLGCGFTAGSAEGSYEFEGEDPQALNAALDKARAAGALLLELRQPEEDLEKVLVDSLKAVA